MEIKPRLRGRLHQFAFYYSCVLFTIFIFISGFIGWKWTVAIYLLSQIILFGISSTYHITKWENTKKERIYQRLDHASIFVLISGTQTSTILSLVPITNPIKNFITFSWTLTAVGVLKVFILDDIYEMLDIVLYIFHGISVLFVIKHIFQFFSLFYTFLIVLGGILYVIGGILFGFRIPDINPNIFGYHEFFHALTILANSCFGIPILVEYIKYIQSS